MAAKTFGELSPAAQTKIYDRLAEIALVALRLESLTTNDDTDLDLLMGRVATQRARLDNLRSEIVAARGV